MSNYQSPDVRNYVIGKGSAYFTRAGGVRRHMGNATVFEVEPTVEELDHFSSMSGVRTKDKVAVIEKSAVVRVTLEEFTVENLRLALLGGEATDNTSGDLTFDILDDEMAQGKLEFIGNNAVGPKINYEFPSVAFRPASALSAISEEWGSMELEGEVQAVDGKFGTATVVGAAETPTEEPTETPTE